MTLIPEMSQRKILKAEKNKIKRKEKELTYLPLSYLYNL